MSLSSHIWGICTSNSYYIVTQLAASPYAYIEIATLPLRGVYPE